MVKAGDHVRDESDAGNVGDAWLCWVRRDKGGAGDVGNG